MRRDELRACWYRLRRQMPTGTWMALGSAAGRFHLFTTDHIEYSDGPGPFPCAIVEDDATGTVYVVPAPDVCFGTVPTFAGD